MSTHIIHIEWQGPYRLDQLSELMDSDKDYGIYQIYGGHPVYGANALLYIGKADQQTFGQRIAQERWHLNPDGNAIQVYLGYVTGIRTPSDEQWSQEIDLAERLLIYAHAPAINMRGLGSIPDAALRDVHILNWGYYRDLMPEISGARWTTKHIMQMQIYRVAHSQDEAHRPLLDNPPE